VTICPATTAVPDLAGPEFWPTAKVTRPLPAPVEAASTLIQDTVLVADHGHALAAVTATAPVPPVAPMACVRGLTTYVQAGTPVAWAIVIV
jgi:hypothetical protein